MVTWHGTGSWQRRAGKVEAEVRPAGSSEDGNTGIAQEGFRLELGIGSEAPERCHRRGSAPYFSLTPVHHIHESGLLTSFRENHLQAKYQLGSLF